MNRKKFMQAVSAYPGVEIEETWYGDLVLYAPDGHCFNDGAHMLVEPFANKGGQSWKPQAYTDMATRLQMGISPCDCEDCTQ